MRLLPAVAFVLFGQLVSLPPLAAQTSSASSLSSRSVQRATRLAGELPRVLANDNRGPAGTLRDGVLTVRLELVPGMWHPEAEDGPGLAVQAFAEVGHPPQIPGPVIRVPEGTEIQATIRNTLPDSTLVLYGFHTRPGSPNDTLQVAPGAVREVRFAAGAAGTYYYWGTTTGRAMEDREWVDSQLSGALIVDPPRSAAVAGTAGGAADDAAGHEAGDDRIFVIGIWLQPADSSGPEVRPERETMVINGKSWPHTERLTYTQGDSVRWRWINPSRAPHPMHLHGFYFQVDSRGSWAADRVYEPAQRRLVATELMRVGGTMAARWLPSRPGNWVFHCHFAFHISHFLSLAEPHDAAGGQPDGAAHSVHRMAGLVLGLHVLPGGEGRAAGAPAREPRKLKLVAQSAPGPDGKPRAYGYVLQEGSAEPPPDSVAIPGPTLVLERGEPVSITVVNRLNEPTAVHWHGIELESFPDGVPNWSGTPGRIMPPIAPGDSFVAEFTPPRAGTFIYHSHSNEILQIIGGLYGPLIVVEPGQELDPVRERVIIVGGAGAEGELGGAPPAGGSCGRVPCPPALVNGSPSPPPMDLYAGETYRLRLINIHSDFRVMFSLVSDTSFARWRAVAKDGADLPAAQAVLQPAHLMTGPGETADFEFTPAAPGELRLEIKTGRTGWYIPIPIRVRERPSG